MKYLFPVFNHIESIKPFIKDEDSIKIIEKENYDVLTYLYQHAETFCKSELIEEHNTRFLDPFKCECRGLLFDKKGNLLRRSYHKFFNANEKFETKISNIDWTQPYHVLEKLDGSMITPMFIDGHIRLTTKAGITEVSMAAESWAADKKNYQDLFNLYMNNTHCQWTPIFEWVSNKNRIVLNYKEDGLILTGLRRNNDGRYAEFLTLNNVAKSFNVPVVKQIYSNDIDDIEAFVNQLRNVNDIEGIVIRFQDGHMLKIKTDWYVLLHQTKEQLYKENNVIKLILDENIDDIKAIITDEDKYKLEEFENTFVDNYFKCIEINEELFRHWRENHDRKSFALNIVPNITPILGTICFKSWDGPKEFKNNYKNIVMKHLELNKSVDTISPLWNNACRWNMHDANE